MSLLSILTFIFWVFGAFWIASRVFTKAKLLLQKPNCFYCSSERGNVPLYDLWALENQDSVFFTQDRDDVVRYYFILGIEM